MANAAFSTLEAVDVTVVDFGPDGTTPDTVEALTVANSAPSIVSAAVNPANNRVVVISGANAGSATVTISAPGVTTPLQVVCTVSPPPNLSKIELVSISAPRPK